MKDQMMDRSELKRRLPGYTAAGSMILTTSLWMLWGVGEMFYVGWGLEARGGSRAMSVPLRQRPPALPGSRLAWG